MSEQMIKLLDETIEFVGTVSALLDEYKAELQAERAALVEPPAEELPPPRKDDAGRFKTGTLVRVKVRHPWQVVSPLIRNDFIDGEIIKLDKYRYDGINHIYTGHSAFPGITHRGGILGEWLEEVSEEEVASIAKSFVKEE